MSDGSLIGSIFGKNGPLRSIDLFITVCIFFIIYSILRFGLDIKDQTARFIAAFLSFFIDIFFREEIKNFIAIITNA